MNKTNVKMIVIHRHVGHRLQAVMDRDGKSIRTLYGLYATGLEQSGLISDFGAEMVALLRDIGLAGARGLKFLKDLGLGCSRPGGEVTGDRRSSARCKVMGRMWPPRPSRFSFTRAIPEPFSCPVDSTNDATKNSSSTPTGASTDVTDPVFGAP